MTPILPGSTIGFLGGGQLGRMTAMAARSMGYDVHVLDPDPNCPARAIASRVITASFSDVDAAVELARGCHVVTLEIEQIAVDALEAAERHAPVRPGRAPVYIIQDRIRQKTWLRDEGFPVGDFRTATSADDVVRAVAELGASIAKASHGGYDGRGQVHLTEAAKGSEAWQALGSRPCVVEQRLEIASEVSVLIARRPGGETTVYPPSYNFHEHGVLTWAVIPAPGAGAAWHGAPAVAQAIAERLGIVGLLAVEFFCTTDGRLLVNELAPRPHNTYHHSERACSTGQFEQLVRAVCDLPLGSTTVVNPGAIMNLLGGVWLQSAPPDITAALDVESARLHLYGKSEAREGRKMGHLSTLGTTALEALMRAQQSAALLAPGTFRLQPTVTGWSDRGEIISESPATAR